ncbi:MAG: sulfatase [Acidobacteriota bacterium]|nr:sulfatase [Acidobacteriota bacterium]
MWKLTSAWLPLVLLVVACDAAAPEPEVTATPAEPLNVVLVLGDALRAKSLPFYGGDKPTAPFLTALAERSLVYDNAYSHYSSTWATFSNLFTGEPYSALVDSGRFTAQSRRSHSGGLEESNETLAELLRSAGVRSRAVSANPYLSKEHGFGQGFEAFHDWSDWDPDFWESIRKFRAPEVNQVARGYLEELAAGAEPWFLVLLYFETHNPYQPGPEQRELLVDAAYPRSDRNRGGTPRDADGETLKYLTAEDREWYSESDAEHLKSLYEAEVLAFDAGVRELFGHLRRLWLLDDTVVIIAADHGESLFERGYFGHGFLSRDEVQHVPMLVVNPKTPPRRVSGVTGTSDLFFSILDHFGVDVEPERRSPWCMDLMNGRQIGSVMLSEGPGKTRVLRDERYSLYRHLDVEGRFPIPVENGDYLYDRLEDPLETSNLFEQEGRAAEAAAIRERLFERLVVDLRDRTTTEDPFLEGDEERLRRLRALGYFD